MKIYDCECEYELDSGVKKGTGYLLVNRCIVCESRIAASRVEVMKAEAEMNKNILIAEESRRLAEKSLRERGLI